jgi:hypothetical protein
MNETILNIYLIINHNLIEALKVVSYQLDGGDDSKIDFLIKHSKDDFTKAFHFDAPCDKQGNFMSYNSFHKLEKRGMHYQLFEEIFQRYDLPEKPMICVTPVVDGMIYSQQ